MMTTIYINLAGISLIGFILWWFIFYRPSGQAVVGEEIEITVKDGVYEPAHIKIKRGQRARLCFHRVDSSPCAEVVLFESLGISRKLPLNKIVEIPILIEVAGEYEFTCQMKMYRGTLVIE